MPGGLELLLSFMSKTKPRCSLLRHNGTVLYIFLFKCIVGPPAGCNKGHLGAQSLAGNWGHLGEGETDNLLRFAKLPTF